MSAVDAALEAFFADGFAERIASFRIPPASETRLEYLRARSSDGLLTPEERVEYERFVDVLDLLSLFRLEARAVLDRRAS